MSYSVGSKATGNNCGSYQLQPLTIGNCLKTADIQSQLFFTQSHNAYNASDAGYVLGEMSAVGTWFSIGKNRLLFLKLFYTSSTYTQNSRQLAKNIFRETFFVQFFIAIGTSQFGETLLQLQSCIWIVMVHKRQAPEFYTIFIWAALGN